MAQIIDHNLRALHISSRAELENIQQKLDCRPRARNQENALWRRADTSGGEPAIPNPKLFQALESLHDGADVNTLPEPCECAVHLELLEVFHTLRVYILSSKELDTTFGIFLRKRTVYRQRRYIQVPVKVRDDTIQERRAQKWPYYLNIAATSFKIWAKQIDNEISARSGTERGIVLKYLPPLDVLMIWHAYLLNPQDFADYCRENQLNYLNRVPFPWSQIHDAIHPKDLAYSLPQESSEWLRSSAKLEPDLLQYLIEAGKTVNSATPILSRFGKRTSTLDSPPVLSLGELFGMNDTTARELSFLKVLQASEAQKAQNRCLVDNVQRQAAFVGKMHAHLWIRSPAIEGTLRRAVDRYDKFLQLFKLYPNKMLVPTLDIDLVWHTHQLSATRYTSAMLQRAGRFINHDDKLGKGLLDEAMSQTKDLFRVRFGLEYSVCLCWDCEAAASALELSEHGEMFEESCIDALVDRVQQDVSYYRAVELARRMRQPLPVRLA